MDTGHTESGFWDLDDELPEDPAVLELRARQQASRARCVARHGQAYGETDPYAYDPTDEGLEPTEE